MFFCDLAVCCADWIIRPAWLAYFFSMRRAGKAGVVSPGLMMGQNADAHFVISAELLTGSNPVAFPA